MPGGGIKSISWKDPVKQDRLLIKAPVELFKEGPGCRVVFEPGISKTKLPARLGILQTGGFVTELLFYAMHDPPSGIPVLLSILISI